MSPADMKIPEAAAHMKLSPKTIWEWVTKGYGKTGIRLAAQQRGRQWFINRNTLEAFPAKIRERS